MNHIKNFEYIVYGEVIREDMNYANPKLIIKEVYKGNIENDTIQLADGGVDCYQIFAFKSGTKLIIGLLSSPYSNMKEAYVAQGCITSTLIVTNENKVKANNRFLALRLRNPKISWISSSMNLKKLIRKIERRK